MSRKSFYEIVDPVLQERGIKKSTFCKAIGVHPNMYGEYKRGTEPKVETIRKAEDYLGISILTINEKNPATLSDGNLGSKYDYVIGLFDRLPFEKQVELTKWMQDELHRQEAPGDSEA